MLIVRKLFYNKHDRYLFLSPHPSQGLSGRIETSAGPACSYNDPGHSQSLFATINKTLEICGTKSIEGAAVVNEEWSTGEDDRVPGRDGASSHPVGDHNQNLHLFEEFLVLRGAVEQVFRLPVAGKRGQDVAVVWRQKKELFKSTGGF